MLLNLECARLMEGGLRARIWLIAAFCAASVTTAGEFPGDRGEESRKSGRMKQDGQLPVETGGQPSYSVQLHVHSSFSENAGSMQTQSLVSRDEGIDAMWWTDHDGFFTNYQMVSTFSFEAWSEPISQNEYWEANQSSHFTKEKWWSLHTADGLESFTAEISPEAYHEGENSLKLSATTGGPEFSSLLYEFDSDDNRYKRALASGISIGLAIYPFDIGADARVVIEVLLSLHPQQDGGEPWEQLALRYHLMNDSTANPYVDQGVLHVPLAFTANSWNYYLLPVTEDVQSGFDYLYPYDNSLFLVNIGLESRNDQQAGAYFDSFQIFHSEGLDTVMARQRNIMGLLETDVPELTQLQGMELATCPHMNEFGETVIPPDFDSLAVLGGYLDENGWITDIDAFNNFVAHQTVEEAHARGSLVSVNHIFGPKSIAEPASPENMLAVLLENGVYGADMLEVGYRERHEGTLADYLWVWDELAMAGYIVTGTGVTDSHEMMPNEWEHKPNTMISWVYADVPTSDELIAGLSAGRVYFGDITQFDGQLDLRTPEGFHMGQVVLTDRDSADIIVDLTGAGAGNRVELLRNGTCDSTLTLDGPDAEILWQVGLTDTVTVVRIEVFDDVALFPEKVLSNPLYFVRDGVLDSIAANRAAIDVAGIITESVSGFDLTGASVLTRTGKAMLTISGAAADGAITLNTSALELSPAQVSFRDMSGEWSVVDSLVLLTNLDGAGSVRIKFMEGANRAAGNGGEAASETQPLQYSLEASYPNPFNPSTTIRFSVSKPGRTVLRVFDLQGRLVRLLMEENLSAGRHGVTWDGRNEAGMRVASGTYFYRLDSGHFSQTRKMLLLK